MTLSELEPKSKHLVYDLVKEAGVDTSDWANFSGPNPASNPKYCYEWAFWNEAKTIVVVCLWFSSMHERNGEISQELNYRKLSVAGVRAKRARRMDMAFQLAAKRALPIRVIVVDGIRRGEAGADASHVERRMLDPVPWSVASYELETGECRLVRNRPPTLLGIADADRGGGTHRLARIGYNSGGWQRPTGEAGDQESSETYNARNQFGHEDWLFRGEWVIDGWRYAFIQGLNNEARIRHLGEPLDVTLFTILPDKRRRLVATIYGLECLSDEQAKAALTAFRERGWLKTMQDEATAIGGNAEALGDPKWAEHILNVRYRAANVDTYPPDTFLPDDDWIRHRHRYKLYNFEPVDRERVEHALPGRRGRQDAPEVRRLFRRGTYPVEYTPEHGKMQASLMAALQAEYGSACVFRETDFVDVRVETDQELTFFEIKTDLDPRAVIRQALGQLLEYAYHPARTGRQPDRLVIVGRSPPTSTDEAYLQSLREKFKLPLTYRVVAL